MAFDPDKFLSETSNTAAATMPDSGFDPDRFLSETSQPAQPQIPQRNPSGIVRAIQDVAQTPGAMWNAARQAYQQAIPDPIVRDKNGKVIPRSFGERLLDVGSGAVNVMAAPVFAGANQGIKTLSDAFAIQKGQGLLDPLSDQNISNMAQNAGVPINKIQQLPEGVKNLIGERAYQDLGEGANIGVGLLPGVAGIKGAATLGEAAIKGTVGKAADVLANASDRFLSGELKIKQSLAKSAYGGDIMDKKQGILNTINQYNLVTPTGNFEKASKSAEDAISNIETQRANLLSQYTDKNIIPTDILEQSKSLGVPGTEGGAPLGKSKQAQAIIGNILDDAKAAGLDKPTDLNGVMKVRKLLDPDGDLFKNGAFISKDDALDTKIRKSMYFDLLDRVEQDNPQIRDLGREEKKLFDTKAVIDDARSRISNKNPVSFGDWATSLAATGGAHLSGLNTPEALATGAALYGVRKAGAQGRAAAVIGNLSDIARGIAGPKEGPKLPDVVGWNQTGESAPIVSTPAQPQPQSSYPTLGTLTQGAASGDPFYNNTLSPKQYTDLKHMQTFNTRAQSLNAPDVHQDGQPHHRGCLCGAQ